ncbi:hypothetical protein KUCAC02_032834 [Chaenocephalus aceratus]|nr:hypothetical protein KUCAC02_032834 [Chaenocephalus aceratus]
MKMMWFWFCWVLGPVVLASPSLFSLHPSPAIFSVAEAACPSGRLASLSSDQEVSAVLNLVSGSNGSVFWIGLRKVKDACVDPGLPLRGFSWTGGGSRAPQVIRWPGAPGDLHHLTLRRHQAEPDRDQRDQLGPDSRQLQEQKPPTSVKAGGHHGDPLPPRGQQDPGSGGVLVWSAAGLGLLGPPPCLAPDGRICGPTRAPPASSVSQASSEPGPEDCEDIDECSGGAGPCRTSCLNTPGSYRCFCIDDAGESHAEDLPVCAPTLGLLFPLLVAMAVLVVLVVVVAVTVALCMRRKRAMKNKEGYEPANEKEASGGSEL